MGFDLSFYKLKGEALDFDESDVPDVFTHRYDGRQRWHGLMSDVPCSWKRTCSCVGPTHHYFCPDPEAIRPLDFNAYREKLKEAGLWHKPFRSMTRWLERHPEVYVSFSC